MDIFPFYSLTNDEVWFESTVVKNYMDICVAGEHYISWNNLWFPYANDDENPWSNVQFLDF